MPNMHGNPANDCWWCYQDDSDNDGDRDDKRANAASYGADTNWYSDTSAADNITS
jgi:hypothetical protein